MKIIKKQQYYIAKITEPTNQSKGVIKIEYRYCAICGSNHIIENHHIFYRSQVKQLENCKKNQIDLCKKCHTKVHNDFLTDYKLKIELLNYYEMIFDNKNFTFEEIQSILDVNYNAMYRLSKNMKNQKGKYTRESILLAIQGGEDTQQRYEKWMEEKRCFK